MSRNIPPKKTPPSKAPARPSPPPLGYPSDKQDQYMVRFPEGMRDRIKKVATQNNRSMNAEIVSVLEEAFPKPTFAHREQVKIYFDFMSEKYEEHGGLEGGAFPYFLQSHFGEILDALARLGDNFTWKSAGGPPDILNEVLKEYDPESPDFDLSYPQRDLENINTIDHELIESIFMGLISDYNFTIINDYTDKTNNIEHSVLLSKKLYSILGHNIKFRIDIGTIKNSKDEGEACVVDLYIYNITKQKDIAEYENVTFKKLNSLLKKYKHK